MPTPVIESAEQRGASAAPDPRPESVRGQVVSAVPVAVAVVLLFAASWSNGAFALRSWGPLTVFVLAMMALLPRGRPSRAAVAFTAAFAGFALWSAISAAWSPSPGAAIEGAGRDALYAGLTALPVLTLRVRDAAAWLARLLCLGMAVVVAAALLAGAGDGAARFLAGRLNDPVGYRNGTAALFALCAWPLIAVAAHRRLHPLLRAGAFALTVGALGLAYLTQSRGVVLGFACGAVIALALGPDRLRRAWLAILAVAAVAITSPQLLEPYDAFVASGATDPGAAADAVSTLRTAVAAAFVFGLVAALLEGGLRIGAGVERAFRLAAAALLAAGTVAALVAAVAVAGDPVSYVERKADEFKQVDVVAPGSTRLGTTGGQRYDLWRIAWREFESHPVAGGGEGSYPVRYYRERATDRNLSDPHSLPLRVLSELGVVGALLLLAALVAAGASIVIGWRTATPDQRRWSSGLAAAGAVALGQSTVDWLWLIPGLTGLGLVCLGTAVAIVSLSEVPAAGRRPGWRTLPSRAIAVAAAALVALLFLSDAYARESRGASSADRLSGGRTAERLNPYALPPRYLQASALEELGRRDDARRELTDALQLEPESFVTLGLLGDLETRAGRRAEARGYYKRALALNPGDVGLQQLAGER